LDVQSYIRYLRPPVRTSKQVMLVGELDGRIGAFSYFEDADDPSNVFLKVIAVAWDLRKSPRGKGGALGREVLEVTIETILERAREAGCDDDEVSVVGHIDNRNSASQRLCKDFGFVRLSDVEPPGENLAVWQAAFSCDEPSSHEEAQEDS